MSIFEDLNAATESALWGTVAPLVSGVIEIAAPSPIDTLPPSRLILPLRDTLVVDDSTPFIRIEPLRPVPREIKPCGASIDPLTSTVPPPNDDRISPRTSGSTLSAEPLDTVASIWVPASRLTWPPMVVLISPALDTFGAARMTKPPLALIRAPRPTVTSPCVSPATAETRPETRSTISPRARKLSLRSLRDTVRCVRPLEAGTVADPSSRLLTNSEWRSTCALAPNITPDRLSTNTDPSALMLPRIWLGLGLRDGSIRPVTGSIAPTTRLTAIQSALPCWLKVSVVFAPTLKLFHDSSARDCVWLTVTFTAAPLVASVGALAPSQTESPVGSCADLSITLTGTRPPGRSPSTTDWVAAVAAARAAALACATIPAAACTRAWYCWWRARIWFIDGVVAVTVACGVPAWPTLVGTPSAARSPASCAWAGVDDSIAASAAMLLPLSNAERTTCAADAWPRLLRFMRKP